jgi:hypothetical protein
VLRSQRPPDKLNQCPLWGAKRILGGMSASDAVDGARSGASK